MVLTLDRASTVVDAALAKAREMGIRPIAVVVLDEGGHLKVLKREDKSTFLRPTIAIAKAWGALALGSSSRALSERFGDRPGFLQALSGMTGGKIVPVPGGVLIYSAGETVGAVGISGGTSEEDEACAFAGIAAGGFEVPS